MRRKSVSDRHERARIMSLPNDVGPEQIMTGDEYLQSLSNDVVGQSIFFGVKRIVFNSSFYNVFILILLVL